MSGNVDDLKGRAKEAAGNLTDDDSLKREGKVERAEGKAKEEIDEAADKVKDVLAPRLIGRLEGASRSGWACRARRAYLPLRVMEGLRGVMPGGFAPPR